jgi:murein DD-endopeptidase MepM/ murein hydrolase activator NlpD
MKFVATFCTICILFTATIAHAERKSPVDGGTLTSSPGWRLDPFGSGRTVWHNGWDIAVPSGTPVHPTQSGTVYYAGPYKGYGNLVAILHGKGYVSLYGHNQELLVQPGQVVNTKTVIARSGNTGRSTGPHVHYEIRRYKQAEPKETTAAVETALKAAIEQNVEKWVAGFQNGQGGEFTEKVLPEDIDR